AAGATAAPSAALPTVAQPAPGPGDHQHAAIAAARAAQKTEAAQPAPAATPAATPPAKTELAAGDKGDQKGAEAKGDEGKDKGEKPNTVTQRIGDLTRQLRELRETHAAAQSELADLKGKLSAATTSAQKLDEVTKAFDDDPLKAFQMLGKGWKDIVVKVANGGREPTPE